MSEYEKHKWIYTSNKSYYCIKCGINKFRAVKIVQINNFNALDTGHDALNNFCPCITKDEYIIKNIIE